MAKGTGDFSIGSDVWPGLSKLMEEMGEVQQVGGKLMGSAGVEDHWDGANLRTKMVEELGDLSAAIMFFTEHNGLDFEAIAERARYKRNLFEKWHQGNK